VQLLKDNDIEPEIVEYLKHPLSENELKSLADRMGLRPKDFIRKGEKDFKDLGLKDKLEDDNALLNAMADYPKLMERPIAVKGSKAVLGRPPDHILSII
jgi:arsenate reductase